MEDETNEDDLPLKDVLNCDFEEIAKIGPVKVFRITPEDLAKALPALRRNEEEIGKILESWFSNHGESVMSAVLMAVSAGVLDQHCPHPEAVAALHLLCMAGYNVYQRMWVEHRLNHPEKSKTTDNFPEFPSFPDAWRN